MANEINEIYKAVSEAIPVLAGGIIGFFSSYCLHLFQSRERKRAVLRDKAEMISANTAKCGFWLNSYAIEMSNGEFSAFKTWPPAELVEAPINIHFPEAKEELNALLNELTKSVKISNNYGIKIKRGEASIDDLRKAWKDQMSCFRNANNALLSKIKQLAEI